jgi:hypothetical protein|uniref:DUF3310 domain-containing protein n=1 Tax=Prevotella sp. TaxID=59823 RepID=UPI004027B557
MIEEKDIKVGFEFRLFQTEEGSTVRLGEYADYRIIKINKVNGFCVCKRLGNEIEECCLRVECILKYAEKLPMTHDEQKAEQVNHPIHYSWLKDLCGVEPIDICRHFDFAIGNALKYLMRKGKADGDKTEKEKRVEDLRKAVFYIQDEIKKLQTV